MLRVEDGRDMRAVTHQHLPSSLWAESAPQGQMCEADSGAVGETNSCSQRRHDWRVMRLRSKSEQILSSNCVPDLSDHPRAKSPALWKRAPMREEIVFHINHCRDTNSSHKYVIITTPSQQFAWQARGEREQNEWPCFCLQRSTGA